MAAKGDIHSAKEVYWEDQSSVKYGRQEFTGVPFVVIGNKRFDCQFGTDRNKKSKEEKKRYKTETDHEYGRGRTFLLTNSKKLGCSAQVTIREICRFPSYKIDNDCGVERKLREDDLMCRLRRGEEVAHQKVFITCLPGREDHNDHIIDTSLITPEPIDKRISKNINDLVNEGISHPGTIRSQLKTYVKNICQELPHPSNKRFYPSDRTIRNHIYKSKETRLCDDQENIQKWMSELPDDSPDFVD